MGIVNTLREKLARAISPVGGGGDYFAASMFLDGVGTRGQKPRPFNYRLAVAQFHHWCYAAAMVRANAAAGVPLRLYARKRPGRRKAYETRPVGRDTLKYLSGRRGDLRPSEAVRQKAVAFGLEVEEVVEPHPALTVLSGGNPDDNGYELAVERHVELQLTGNHFLYTPTDAAGVPAAAYWMPSEWTEVIPDETGASGSRVAGYVYGKTRACEVTFAPDEVIHFRGVRSGNLHYGKGWVEAAWQSIGLHNAKRTEDLSFKDNMSRPDWMISAPGGASEKALDRLESALKEKFRGVKNAGKFFTAGFDAKATALQFEPKELGTPTRLIEEIAAVSGVPVAMLLANDVNRAGSETARLGFFRGTVRPDCLRDEQKLNQRWVPRFEGSEDYFLAYDHVSFEDEEAATRRVVALVSGGVLSPNEGRNELGYADADGADLLFPPAGNTGGSASVLGDLAPDQNDERRDRKAVQKGVARMPRPAADGAREESETQFLRDAFLGYQKDGTVGDMLANLTDLGKLVDRVGLPRNAEYKEPYVPIVAATGPVVDGETIKDGDGDVVGGGPGIPPVETVQVDRSGGGGSSADAAVSSAPAGDDNAGKDD